MVNVWSLNNLEPKIRGIWIFPKIGFGWKSVSWPLQGFENLKIWQIFYILRKNAKICLSFMQSSWNLDRIITVNKMCPVNFIKSDFRGPFFEILPPLKMSNLAFCPKRCLKWSGFCSNFQERFLYQYTDSVRISMWLIVLLKQILTFSLNVGNLQLHRWEI